MELILLLRAEKAAGSFVARCMYTGIFWCMSEIVYILFRRVVNYYIFLFILFCKRSRASIRPPTLHFVTLPIRPKNKKRDTEKKSKYMDNIL